MTTATRNSARAAKPKRPFAMDYKTYDVAKLGLGNEDEWRGAFQDRMGLEEAQEVLGGRGPRGVLGVSATATWDEIKKAYRAKVMACHPDRVQGDDAKAAATVTLKAINAAYAVLAAEFGK